eukprot:TRINITY_DN74129_c0_g1_i1.p1 TRINITY_DN74129_c0_g1~~TRINITY_DN74129_c0_g1_i1.p1  ORF type:complete len:504 (-),score=108.69 TRINITY_DN74129_c0_g1_i1:153-1664(-)
MRFVVQRKQTSKRAGAWREVVKAQTDEGSAVTNAQSRVRDGVANAAVALVNDEVTVADNSDSAPHNVSAEPREGSVGDSESDGPTKEVLLDVCNSDNDCSTSSERGISNDLSSPTSQSSPWSSFSPSPLQSPQSAICFPQPIEALPPSFPALFASTLAVEPKDVLIATTGSVGESNACQYDTSTLLAYRHSLSNASCTAEWLVHGVLRSAPAVHSERFATKHASAQTKLPTASVSSWGAAQQQRRFASGEVSEIKSNDAVRRSVMSILNKLTPEKFDTLYSKLLECGISTWTHVEVLAQGIFEKATVQPPFASMYADLCVRFVSDLCDEACWFRHLLLSRCWENFESTFESATEETDILATPSRTSSEEEEEEAKVFRKKRALGNVRFVGELLIRGLLFPEDMFTCTEALLKTPPSAGCLEALATFLKIVGPYYDDASWAHHSQLKIVFWHIRGILFDPLVPKRVRFLLEDVMDLREAGWVDTKVATQVDQPKRLEEVRIDCS